MIIVDNSNNHYDTEFIVMGEHKETPHIVVSWDGDIGKYKCLYNDESQEITNVREFCELMLQLQNEDARHAL